MRARQLKGLRSATSWEALGSFSSVAWLGAILLHTGTLHLYRGASSRAVFERATSRLPLPRGLDRRARAVKLDGFGRWRLLKARPMANNYLSHV
jgi:hypothetical protein